MPGATYPCPGCRKEVQQGAPFFPFCSDRCRLLDLGEWLSERYRVSRPLAPEPSADALKDGEDSEDLSSEESHED